MIGDGQSIIRTLRLEDSLLMTQSAQFQYFLQFVISPTLKSFQYDQAEKDNLVLDEFPVSNNK